MEHKVKILPEYFERVLEGLKTFEIRNNDREYETGDTIILQEWDSEQEYTGREITKIIGWLTKDEELAVSEGYVVFSLLDKTPDIKDLKEYIQMHDSLLDERAELEHGLRTLKTNKMSISKPILLLEDRIQEIDKDLKKILEMKVSIID